MVTAYYIACAEVKILLKVREGGNIHPEFGQSGKVWSKQ
jgi:hypothetical protein